MGNLISILAILLLALSVLKFIRVRIRIKQFLRQSAIEYADFAQNVLPRLLLLQEKLFQRLEKELGFETITLKDEENSISYANKDGIEVHTCPFKNGLRVSLYVMVSGRETNLFCTVSSGKIEYLQARGDDLFLNSEEDIEEAVRFIKARLKPAEYLLSSRPRVHRK